MAQWEGARAWAAEGWSHGPHLWTYERELFWNDEEVRVSLAFGFRVQRGGKLRAVDDLEMSDAAGAAATHAPLHLPWRDRITKLSR